ncbi:MAG: DNA-methyltransferase [Dehalococcoidia bacterium]
MKMELQPIYATRLGRAYCADAIQVLARVPSASIDLVLTSPPYGLHFKKEYGNVAHHQYVEWFLPFAYEIKRILKPAGSFVLNIGGSWVAGAPVRSLYPFRLLIALCDEVGFNLCQEFFWYSLAKMPAPAEWVNVRRIRVKDSVEYIYWLSGGEFPKADNTAVLEEYSDDMRRLIRRGVKTTKRPSGHSITEKFSRDRGGSIPANIIQCGNNESNSRYIKMSKEQ